MAWLKTKDYEALKRLGPGASGHLLYDSRRFPGVGVEIIISGFGVKGLSSASLQVQDPVTVPTTTRKDLHKTVVLILREGLQQLGVHNVRDVEIGVIGWSQPKHRISRGVKLHFHTVLLRVHPGGVDVPEIPQGDWIFAVILETKKENIVRHAVKRIRKARVKRRVDRAFAAGEGIRRKGVEE